MQCNWTENHFGLKHHRKKKEDMLDAWAKMASAEASS
jgi:hypothetical protein